MEKAGRESGFTALGRGGQSQEDAAMCCAWMPKIHKYGKYNGSFVTTRRSPKSNKCSVEESNLTQVASAMQTKVQTTVAMPVSTAYGTTTSRTTEDAFNILQSIKSVFNRPGFFHPIYISFLSTSYLKIITAEKKNGKKNTPQVQQHSCCLSGAA